MKTTSKTTLLWLRVFHMLFATLWFGGVVGALASGGTALYARLALPAALLTLLSGLHYGFRTPWRFIRLHWIIVEWVLTLLTLPLTALSALWGAAPAGFLRAAGILQAVLLTAAMIVAITKPGGKKVVIYAPRRKERTETELRDAIEKDRRPL